MSRNKNKQRLFDVSISNKPNRYILWFSILFVGIIIGISMNSKDPAESVDHSEKPVYSLATADIASQFVRSCGSCGEKDLDICTCPTVKSTKQFIEMNLNNGASTADVIELVKVAFGHFKS